MKEALNGIGPLSRKGASRRSMSRTASETSTATSNMVRAFHRLGGPSGTSLRCFSTLITACVPAKLPELSKISTRSPGRSNTVILQNLAKLSTPACVRESDARTIPSLSRMPTQYVMYGALQLALISSVHTLKLASVEGPKLVVSAQSAASLPLAIRMRPMRGILLRGSKVYQRRRDRPRTRPQNPSANRVEACRYRRDSQCSNALGYSYNGRTRRRDGQSRDRRPGDPETLEPRSSLGPKGRSRTECADARNRRWLGRASSQSAPHRTIATRSPTTGRSRNTCYLAGRARPHRGAPPRAAARAKALPDRGFRC